MTRTHGLAGAHVLVAGARRTGASVVDVLLEVGATVTVADADPARTFLDQTFSAKWITDFTLSAQLLKQLMLTVGVNNIFNVYPDKVYVNPRNDPNNFSVDPNLSYTSSLDNSNRGRYLYNPNQFGYNGAFYFTRLAVTL